MPAIFDRVIVLNLIANTAIFYIAARLYLLPLVSRLRPQQILAPMGAAVARNTLRHFRSSPTPLGQLKLSIDTCVYFIFG